MNRKRRPAGYAEGQPEKSVWQSESDTPVRDALERLPEDQREAIHCAFFSGLTQTEISEKLGAPLGTIKARIRRGMLKLSGVFDGDMIDERTEELASLHVIGLLDGEEGRRFREQLRVESELARFVSEMESVAAKLAYTSPPRTPPPELRERILDGIRSEKIEPMPRQANWFPWALAACLAVLAGVLATDRFRLKRELAAALDQRRAFPDSDRHPLLDGRGRPERGGRGRVGFLRSKRASSRWCEYARAKGGSGLPALGH